MGWFTDSDVLAVGGTPSFSMGDWIAKDFEQITIDDTVGGVGFTIAKLLNSGLICKAARCVAADADIVFREDGGAPTGNAGNLRANSSEFVIVGYNQLVKFRAISAGRCQRRSQRDVLLLIMATLTDFQAKYANVMQDVGNLLTEADRDAFIAEAVKSYSIDRPAVIVKAVTGDGGFDYDLPADWVAEFSQVKSIEYPAGHQVPIHLADDEFLIYKGESSESLRFVSFTPGMAETFIMTYTVLHRVDESGSTIPAHDQDAVVNLAGALASYAIARNLAQNMDTDLDPVTMWRSVNRYKEHGQILEELYRRHISGQAAPPASLSYNWNLKPSWRKRGVAGWQTKTD